MYLLDGKIVKINEWQEIKGTRFPPYWFAEESARIEAGIIEVPDPAEANPVFYNITRLDTGEYLTVPKSLEDVKMALKELVTTRRKQVEAQGITLPTGIVVLTTRDDQDRIDTVLNNMERYDIESIDFKAANGWNNLRYADIKLIGQYIVQHVQACFTTEKQKHLAINNLTSFKQALEFKVEEGWPK